VFATHPPCVGVQVLRCARLPALLLAAAALLAAACGGSSTLPVAPAPLPPPPPKVAILSVDGLRPDAIPLSGASNILDLTERGAFTWQAQTVFPPTTLPAHASMLTGYPPATHGLTWNDYQPARGSCKVSTIFDYAHRAGLRTVMVVGKPKFGHLNVPGTLDQYVMGSGDQDVANKAVVEVQAGFDLLFVHLPDTDVTGHAAGWMSEKYLNQIADTDRAIGRILAALPPETTIILTGDHGGLYRDHGVNRREDMTIPWIIVGPDVTPGLALQVPVNTIDTAATVLQVLRLPLPPDLKGRPVLDAFRPTAFRPSLALHP